MSLHSALLLGAIMILGASCAVDEPATSVVGQQLCGSWLCGGNSPTIAGIDFYDLNLNHLPNNRQIQITSFTNNGYTWTPHVYRGRFTATRVSP